MKIATDESNRFCWEKIIHLFSQPKKVRLRIVETVFLSTHDASENLSQITSWHFTSKKGEVNRRKDVSNLTLQHVYDRFCRFALAGSKSKGARIVAIGYHENCRAKTRVHFTAEQMEREAKARKGVLLRGCTYLQCYLHPFQGNEQHFRGVYTVRKLKSRSSGEDEFEKDTMVYLVEDSLVSTENNNNLKSEQCSSVHEKVNGAGTLSETVRKDIDGLMTIILECLESKVKLSLKGCVEKIARFSADFSMDEERKIWLTCVDNVVLKETSHNEMERDFCENPILPQLNDGTCRNSSPLKQIDENEEITAEVFEEACLHHSNLRNSSSEKGEREELPSIPAQGIDHSIGIENKIIRLKEELVLKTESEQKHFSKIKNLRSEAKTSLNIVKDELYTGVQNQNKRGQSEEQFKDDYSEVDKGRLEDIGTSLGFHEKCTDEIENELKGVREENELLRNVIADRGQHDEIINILEQQCIELTKQLKNEQFHQNEEDRDLAEKLKQSLRALHASKDRLELLEVDMKNKQDCNEKAMRQLKAANKLLEAELESQKEYMQELKNSAWTELATKVKAGVEAITSKEIAKSSMGASKSVTACEDRWRKRLEEANIAHTDEIMRLREEHKQEMRYKQSQFTIQIEESQVEIENRLQQQHMDSLKATLNHKESQQQIELKNEKKKWEQMALEMKARLKSEFQQNKHRELKERDNSWKLKLEKVAREATISLQEELDRSKKLIEKTQRSNQINLNQVLSDAEKARELAREEGRELEKKESFRRFEDTKKELLNSWQTEKATLIQTLKEETKGCLAQAKDRERKLLEEMKEKISRLNEEHQKEIENLKLANAEAQKDASKLIEKKVKEKESILTSQFEKMAEKIKQEYGAAAEETKAVEEARYENVWNEANETIASRIASIKEEGKKDTEKMMTEVELEHENQIQTLEYELGWLRNQKKTSEDTTESLRKSVTLKDSQMEEMEEDMNSDKVHHSYQKFFLITKALQLKQDLNSLDASYVKKIERINQLHDESEKRLQAHAESLEKRAAKSEGNMKLISSTLLNHKKDVLLDHKMKSREVAKSLNETLEKIQAVEAKRKKAGSFVDNLVQAMHDVERQLQDHSQTSALQGGKINISHARKKRRLDEEYEQILNKIELRRDELNEIDEEGKKLEKQKTMANDEMRKLEKSFVSLLVEQQKTLLSISTRGATKEMESKSLP